MKQTLQQIAQLTDGVYYHAENEDELEDRVRQRRITIGRQAGEDRDYGLLAGVSVVLMLIGGALSLAWFSRLP